MGRTWRDWRAVVDRRARFTWLVGLALAAFVSIAEIMGAAMIVAALRLVTEPTGASIELPLVGDVERRLPGSDRVADLRWLAVIATIFFLARGALALTQLYVVYRSSFSLGVRLCDRAIAALLAKPYEWHLQQNSAELATVATSVTQQFVVSFFTPAQAAGAHLLVILAITSTAVAVEPVGTLVAGLSLTVIVTLTVMMTQRPLLTLGQADVEETTRTQRLAGETLAAVREVKLLNLSEALRRDIWSSRWRWATTNRRRSTLIALPRVVIETAGFVSLICFFAVRGSVGADALAAAGVLGYAIVRLLPTTNNLISSLNTARGAQASMRVLAEMLEKPALEAVASGTPVANRTVSVRDVQFGWEDGKLILDGVSLDIPEGYCLGVVGRTGSGKSTLLDLICGLLEPDDGTITVGTQPLANHRDWWWQQVGVVPQTVTLLDDTVAANIALGASATEIDLDRLHRVIWLAQLKEVVESLPLGTDTRIGERGVRLSGGQRQRLAIARALYRDPPVIVLDEGTSALDAATEREVIRALRDQPGRTLIMVAHRLSTLVECDEIVVLEGGSVQARGTYDVLMRTDERFRQLAAATST